jgi:hypothetical protein
MKQACLPWQKPAQSSCTVKDTFERLKCIMLETMTDQGHVTPEMQLWLGMLAQIDQDRDVAAAYRAQYAQTRQDMIALLSDCQSVGQIGPDRTIEEEAEHLLALADGLMVSGTGDPRYHDVPRIKRIMARHIDTISAIKRLKE